MKKSVIFGGVTAMLLGSAAIYAAPAATKANADGVVTKAESLAKADKMFAKMDVNGDGKLDAGDREARVKQQFAEMDADKNGALTESEFVAAHAAREAKMQAMRADWKDKRMADAGPPLPGMDGGPDGLGGPGGHHGGKHGRMGGHGGGMKMMAMADTNGDKAISKAEFRTAAEARFAKADTNGDGKITQEERKAGKPHWRKGGPDMPPPPAAG